MTGSPAATDTASRPRRSGAWLLVAVLYLAGAAHWVWFFGTAEEPFRGPSFTREDWPKEYRYYSILQQAVRQGEAPYYISRPVHTRRFLSLPEVNWSPQVLLLYFVPVGPFVLLQTLLLYSVGFVGLLLLKRRLGLGPLAFAFLFLLFDFNGHLTAHIAVGHSMWAGHFLLSFVVLLVLALDQDPGARPLPPALALVIFAILLQGGFHAFVWCCLLLVLLAAFDRRKWRPVLETLVWTGLLSACRLLPAYFLLNRRDQSFLSGFPGVHELWRGLVSLVPASVPRRGGFFDTLNWWEFDHYVGPVGLAWLLYFGVWRSWRGRERPPLRLVAPLLVLVILSLGDLYAWFNALPIPLLSAERVSTRFLLLPLLFLTVFAAVRMEEWQRERPGRTRPVVGWAVLSLLAVTLGAHSGLWRIESLERIQPERQGRLEIAIDPLPDPLIGRDLAYVRTVQAATCLSLGTLVLLLLRLRRACAPPGRRTPGASVVSAASG